MRQWGILLGAVVMTAGLGSGLFGAQPGVQTIEQAEVSASCSVSHYETDGVRALGQYIPADAGAKETIQYLCFLPSNESAKTEAGFPMILFLHGAGERGTNPEAVAVHGPPMLAKTRAEEWPFITISPQCADGKHWSADQLLELLDQVESLYPVDKSRVYVTGLSMGGFGTWMLMGKAPKRFAAAVPICGGGDPALAKKMLDIPIWVYHGASDSVVPVTESEKMVQAVWALGGTNIKLTEYVGVDHNSWTQTYDNPELYKWLLKQSKQN